MNEIEERELNKQWREYFKNKFTSCKTYENQKSLNTFIRSKLYSFFNKLANYFDYEMRFKKEYHNRLVDDANMCFDKDWDGKQVISMPQTIEDRIKSIEAVISLLKQFKGTDEKDNVFDSILQDKTKELVELKSEIKNDIQ